MGQTLSVLLWGMFKSLDGNEEVFVGGGSGSGSSCSGGGDIESGDAAVLHNETTARYRGSRNETTYCPPAGGLENVRIDL
jgi:hypothetical protein